MAGDSVRVTIDTLLAKKRRGEKIIRVVLGDYLMARLADAAGVDMILVGDSVGMTLLGYPNTLPVTMEEMIHHCRAVVRGCERCFVVGDLPFMSYEAGASDAVRSAGRLVKEAGVDAVKLEGGRHMAETVRAISRCGIPVHGHIGLTPQRIKRLGGFSAQGETVESAVEVFRDALTLAQAGCFALTVECVPPVVGRLITERLTEVVVVSAGAGPGCDGQSVNLYDLIGLNPDSVFKFAKRYGDAAGLVGECVAEFQRETREGLYPAEEYCYNVAGEVAERIEEAVARIKP